MTRLQRTIGVVAVIGALWMGLSALAHHSLAAVAWWTLLVLFGALGLVQDWRKGRRDSGTK